MEELKEVVEKPKRPELLNVLCILTFIGSGLASFSNFFLYINYYMLFESFENGEILLPGIEIIFSLPKEFYFFSFILYLGSLVGARFMWIMRKLGFHIYTTSQILLIILPSIYLKTETSPLFPMLVTGIFVFLYYKNLKFMH